jgi:hypothetical protein
LLIQIIRDAESELEIIMADSEPVKKARAAEMRQLRGRRTYSAVLDRRHELHRRMKEAVN